PSAVILAAAGGGCLPGSDRDVAVLGRGYAHLVQTADGSTLAGVCAGVRHPRGPAPVLAAGRL
ncbi:MAG: hypothetical protein ACXVYV_05350, partial [Gaiellales bacterium]